MPLCRLRSLQRADHRAQHFGRDVRIASRCLQFAVAEQHLYHPDVNALLQEMGRKTVPQGMHRHAFVDVCRRMNGAIELPGRQWIDRILPGEKPATI